MVYPKPLKHCFPLVQPVCDRNSKGSAPSTDVLKARHTVSEGWPRSDSRSTLTGGRSGPQTLETATYRGGRDPRDRPSPPSTSGPTGPDAACAPARYAQ